MNEQLSAIASAKDVWLQGMVQTPVLRFDTHLATAFQTRLIRLDEINEEGHLAYRQALANVYAALDPEQAVRFLYLLDGSPSGVSLYFGVVADSAGGEVHEAMKSPRGAVSGHGLRRTNLPREHVRHPRVFGSLGFRCHLRHGSRLRRLRSPSRSADQIGHRQGLFCNTTIV